MMEMDFIYGQTKINTREVLKKVKSMDSVVGNKTGSCTPDSLLLTNVKGLG